MPRRKLTSAGVIAVLRATRADRAIKAVRRGIPAFTIALILLALATPVAARPAEISRPTNSYAGINTCDLKIAVRGGSQVDTSVTAGLGQEVELYGSSFPPDTVINGVMVPVGEISGDAFSVTADSAGDFLFVFYFLPGTEATWEIRAPADGLAACSNHEIVHVDVVTGHPFADIGAHLFEAEITWLYQRAITTGCGTTVFCPDAVVTREQMASFLARALALPPPIGDYFVDDAGSPHESDINRVAEAGIAFGCGAYLFCPGQAVTREQMASFLVRGLGLVATASDFFTDDETSIHEDDINRLAASGITAGCTSTTFCPTMPVTRGQMAAFLERALF